MRAYITGSRAYGHVKQDSDVDLVVALWERDYRILWGVCKDKSNPKKLMFDNLNLVAFNMDDADDAIRFEKWHKVHKGLVAKAPVTKEEAIAAFRAADAEHVYVKSRQ